MIVQSFEIDVEKIAGSITVTEAAAQHFLRQTQKTGRNGVRLSLKESGCTGFKYVMDDVDEGGPDDLMKKLDNGVRLYIDPKNISSLQGLEIDYRQEGLNRNLVMNNPNVKDACGCGESFSF